MCLMCASSHADWRQGWVVCVCVSGVTHNWEILLWSREQRKWAHRDAFYNARHLALFIVCEVNHSNKWSWRSERPAVLFSSSVGFLLSVKNQLSASHLIAIILYLFSPFPHFPKQNNNVKFFLKHSPVKFGLEQVSIQASFVFFFF